MKKTHKFCNKFIFNQISLWEERGTMGLEYPRPESLSRFQKSFKGVWLDTVTSNLFAYPPLYFIIINNTNIT